MSRHMGVSCDFCLTDNFRGKRFKCLLCSDYDLCATCYEEGVSAVHNADHPMQCILTRSDLDLYFGGETTSVKHAQAFTCPFCGQMGLTEAELMDHVVDEHSESSIETLCPICASKPGSEHTDLIEDFIAHLALDHRNRGTNQTTGSSHIRRMPHTLSETITNRAHRSQIQFTTSGSAYVPPSSIDPLDPFNDLLSHLSSLGLSNHAQYNTSSQLQQMQRHLQMELQQAQATRQESERLSSLRQNAATSKTTTSDSVKSLQTHRAVASPSVSPVSSGSRFLLARYTNPVISKNEKQTMEVKHTERSLFIQELLLNTIGEPFNNQDETV